VARNPESLRKLGFTVDEFDISCLPLFDEGNMWSDEDAYKLDAQTDASSSKLNTAIETFKCDGGASRPFWKAILSLFETMFSQIVFCQPPTLCNATEAGAQANTSPSGIVSLLCWTLGHSTYSE
jgi:hypothetical protein